MHDLRPIGAGQLRDVECCGLFAVLALHLCFLIAAVALNLVVSRIKRCWEGFYRWLEWCQRNQHSA